MTTIVTMVEAQIEAEFGSLARAINSRAGATDADPFVTVTHFTPERWRSEHRTPLAYEAPSRFADGRPGFDIAVCVPLLANRLAEHLGSPLDNRLAELGRPDNPGVVDAYLLALTMVFLIMIGRWPISFDDALRILEQESDASAAIFTHIDLATTA